LLHRNAMTRPKPAATSQHPLELSTAQMRALVGQAMERITAHVTSLPDQPMHHTAGANKLVAGLEEPLPEKGVPFERLLKTLFGRVIPHSLNTASPGYLAYIPGGGLFHAAVADLIANATNRYVGVWLAGPGLVQLETNVIRWCCAMAGLPKDAGGVLTSGGSLANLTALTAARHARLPPRFQDGVLYVSDQVHHSVVKAARVVGILPDHVREIPTDAAFKMRVDLLRDAIAQDRGAGRLPFCVVGNGGTTNTGAVDDLPALGALCAREKLWFHVDAAYGGFFALTRRGKTALAGLEHADSITLDPHKGLFLPYGTGCLLVRDVAQLKAAHQVTAAYMPPSQQDAGHWDFADLSVELSRDWRGLRVWLPIKMHGAKVFRAALDEKLDLARELAQRLATLPDVEVVEPTLSLLAFRLVPPGLAAEDVDSLNRKLLGAINARQHVLLTGTVAQGKFWLRVCVLSFRTHENRMDVLWDDLQHALKDVAL
jgi:aromatic-L-amino-acid decarboxylase